MNKILDDWNINPNDFEGSMVCIHTDKANDISSNNKHISTYIHFFIYHI